MTRIRKIYLTVGALALLFVEMTFFAADKKETIQQSELPSADGKVFWTYITETNPYREWEVWPGYEELVKGESHSVWLKTYANDIAMQAARDGKKEMPYGAILVKDNFAEDKKTLKVVSPMYKVKDFNPDGDNWFWAKYGPEGEILAQGKVKACMDCHRQANDWRFSPFKK